MFRRSRAISYSLNCASQYFEWNIGFEVSEADDHSFTVAINLTTWEFGFFIQPSSF